MNDQALTLRKLMHHRMPHHQKPLKPIRVISVTSGKGGVGKTHTVANLALLFQQAGQKVLVLDGDFGLANLNIIMGLQSKHSIEDVMSGRKEIDEILLEGPHGMKIIPASSGILKMTQWSSSDQAYLMEKLESLTEQFDILLIDTGAGIHSDVAYLNAAANEILVIATPEPTSIADAYALMKIMSHNYKVNQFKLLINMVDSAHESKVVYQNLLEVSDQFLNIRIEYLGYVLKDAKVNQSILKRKLLCDYYPHSHASRCLNVISKSILSSPVNFEVTGNVQFFWRTFLSEVHA